MKKLKYILASVVLATAFTSCETEAIDEKLKDETVAGKPILRFELNDKQTIVTDKVEVKWTGGSSGAFLIRAKISIYNFENVGMENSLDKYYAGYLNINYSAFSIGNYPSRLSLDNPRNYVSSAVLEIQKIIEKDQVKRRVWFKYYTDNAAENEEAGFSNINYINDKAKNFYGNFEYVLYPEEGTGEKVQRVSNGQYNYIDFE